MNLDLTFKEGTVYNLTSTQVHKGKDEVTLIKADFVSPSTEQGRLIPPFYRIPVEFWACKLAERLQEGDRIVLEGSNVMYEIEKDGRKTKRYAIRVKKFTFINRNSTTTEEKEAV